MVLTRIGSLSNHSMSGCEDWVMTVHCHLLQRLAFSQLNLFSWDILHAKYHGP
jgi:hypothetical protein